MVLQNAAAKTKKNQNNKPNYGSSHPINHQLVLKSQVSKHGADLGPTWR